MKRINHWLTFVCLALVMTAFKADHVITIFMIGDSTMANKQIKNGNLERGWGMALQCYFDDAIRVDNHAVNGRSSKSFIDEGRWQKVVDKIRPGDYVFIQFGHNDEKPKADRHTDPGSTFDDNLRRFVRETRAKGGIPVLFNCVVRRNFFKQVPRNDDDEALRKTVGAPVNTKGEEVFSSPYSYYNTKNRNFSEGLAAVCDDGKWGWINQKGELVIPLSIEAEDVGLFSEGLVYCQNSSEDFSFVDKNGTVVFTGKTNFLSYLKVGHSASGYYSKDFPKFRDGFAYVNDDFNTVSKYTKYDKQGKKCGTISENELPEYRLIREDELGIFELYTVHMGLKGKDGNVLIKPYYSLIGTYDAYTIAQVSNGVVLVMLVEFSKYDNNVIYHYGYADLKGHDTFSKEIKEKVNKSREVFYQQLQEEESLQEGDEDGGSSSYSSNASSHPTTSVNAGSPKQEKELKIMARLHELGDEGRNLVLELSAMRQRGQMDPARYLYIKQALIQYKDEQIRLSQELGDEQMVREYMQQKDGVLQSFRMIENGY